MIQIASAYCSRSMLGIPTAVDQRVDLCVVRDRHRADDVLVGGAFAAVWVSAVSTAD
eukprot:SAG31_NODE_3626_length_4055_cov_16.812184_5_plen_57_part_00